MLDPLRYYFENFIAFSRPSWLAVIEDYNTAIFPAQVIGVGFGLVIIWQLLIWTRFSRAQLRLALVMLSLGSIMVGGILHLQYLLVLDWSAKTVGCMFILQGLLLAGTACFLPSSIVVSRGRYRNLILLSAMLGVVGYAFLQWLLGQHLNQLSWVGTGTGSTAVINVAMVMALPRRFSWLILVPWLWSIRQFTVSWPLHDFAGMLLLPWLTLCLLAALLCTREKSIA